MILYRAEFLHSIRDENTKNCYWTHLPYSHASSPVSVHIPDDTLAATWLINLYSTVHDPAEQAGAEHPLKTTIFLPLGLAMASTIPAIQKQNKLISLSHDVWHIGHLERLFFAATTTCFQIQSQSVLYYVFIA